MSAYYNEFEPYAAQWLRNLIAAGHLPAGDVDERSIVDVRPDDLRGYDQAHFFAGIGGWPYALRLAGVPDDFPVWTGSCPCQPFSVAGAGKGTADPRHLWPEFHRLIRESEHRPPVVFGEQVASKAGRVWLTGVRADLEALGYGVGAADLCAAGVSAPHIRQRLYWVADANGRRRGQRDAGQRAISEPNARGDGGLADTSSERVRAGRGEHAGASGTGEGEASERKRLRADAGNAGGLGNTDDAKGARLEQHGSGNGPEASQYHQATPWSNSILIPCGDGKSRRIEPGLPPLAHGVPARVGKLRAYGNAIVPALAAEFVMAALAGVRV